MAAKKFVFRVTLDSGIVQGMDFAAITSEDLPAGLGEVTIGMAVGGANNNGSILYVDPTGNLADVTGGQFAFDPTGVYPTGIGKKFTLYIGDNTAAGDGGRIALRDPVNGHWVSIHYRFGFLIFSSAGLNVPAVFESVNATGFISSDGAISGGDGAFIIGLVDILAKTASVGLKIKANVTAPDDVARFNDSSDVIGSRFNKDGYFVTAKVAAPADGDLANSELAFWLDDTPGATKAMFKAKDSGGTVRTGSVNLT